MLVVSTQRSASYTARLFVALCWSSDGGSGCASGVNQSFVTNFSATLYIMLCNVHRVIDIRNSLSSNIVNANSISLFEQKLESVDFIPFVQVQ